MDMAVVKKWLIFFVGILCAIVIADAWSNKIVAVAGITGPTRFIVTFILYAAIFFGVLYALEKLFKINFFRFGQK